MVHVHVIGKYTGPRMPILIAPYVPMGMLYSSGMRLPSLIHDSVWRSSDGRKGPGPRARTTLWHSLFQWGGKRGADVDLIPVMRILQGAHDPAAAQLQLLEPSLSFAFFPNFERHVGRDSRWSCRLPIEIKNSTSYLQIHDLKG